MGTETNPEDDLAVLSRIIRSRRTSMVVDAERSVPEDLVASLCELAQWAPNHKRTWPWRFALVAGAARATLGATIADAMDRRGDPPEKVAKTRSKYLRTPATLVVGSAPGDTALRSAENRDATAAGIQNLLLAATAAGLATYWGSCPEGAHEAVGAFCAFDTATHISALIYLGWTASATGAPERPTPRFTVIGK